MNHYLNKRDTQRFERLKVKLGIKTKAEELVLRHIFYRDINRQILVHNFGEIREYEAGHGSRWVKITTSTNKHSLLFSANAERIESGDERELYQKIN